MMIREHGTFNQISTGGWVNEHGVHWNLYVLARVDYGPGGDLLALYEDDTKEVAVEIGTRWFAEVRNGVIDWTSANPSTLNPHSDALVIETTEPIAAGMRYQEGTFRPAPPLPPEPHTIDKARFFDDFTDEQFDLWDQRFATATARQRVTWSNGTIFRSDEPSWPIVQGLMVHIFGETAGKTMAPDHPAPPAA